jgi:hypothetical protein
MTKSIDKILLVDVSFKFLHGKIDLIMLFVLSVPSQRMLIGDCGEISVEEVDLLDLSHAGGNYGWNIFEGTVCFENNSLCDEICMFEHHIFFYQQCNEMANLCFHSSNMIVAIG